MLKALLGHWKAHRKKPSLLPEDGDVHFEEPTTINPIFEDSDSSISSNKEAEEDSAGESPTATPVPDLAEELVSKPESDKLVDLSVPSTSCKTELSESVVNKEPEILGQNESKQSVDDSAADVVQDETLVSAQCESSVPDEYYEHGGSVSADGKGKMRIYQPPSNNASSNQKSTPQANISNKKEWLTPKNSEVLGNTKTIKEVVQEGKRPGILKNKDNQFVTDKTKLSPSLLNANKETENPANIRARAIDELIKKFQERSNDRSESNTKSDSDKLKESNSVNNFTKIVNGITKVEQNDSLSSSKPTQKTELLYKKDLQKESLSNIFKFPPPPPLENLKQPSRLYGKILAQTSKPTSPNLSHSDEAKDVVDKSETTHEPGTTRSDSSLERTRVASSLQNDEGPNKETENSATPVSLESSVRESFLHSPKNRDACRKAKAELEQNGNISENHTQQNITRTVNAADAKIHEPAGKVSSSTPIERNARVTQAHASKDNAFYQTSLTENSKVESLLDVPKESRPMSSSEVHQTKNYLQSENSEGFKSEQDAELVDTKTTTTSTANSPQTEVSQDDPVNEPMLTNSHSELEGVNPIQTETNMPSNASSAQKSKLKSSLSKASARTSVNREVETEDSGITRGDQISSEATTQDAVPSNDPGGAPSNPNPRKPKKEKKQKSAGKGHCRKCRRSHDSISTKRNFYDDYYDILTGAARSPKSRHSDSLTSDLSWDERELLRKLHVLRTHKGTLRSNAPSTRSRLSKHEHLGEKAFRRLHRPSSDDSVFFTPSLCSCEECWAQYVREYSYARASLRGMSPIYVECTCKAPRSSALGRRVKFMSDPIPEVPLPEKSSRATSPTSKSDASQPESTASEDKISKKSSDLKDSDSVSQHPHGSKKLKLSEEDYRVLSPWELEQWDYLVRKQLLRKRRNRARCMGLIALALVIFVGLIVTILMLFLKKRVL